MIWASAALPGAAHDLSAARTHGIIGALSSANVMTFADKAYQGAGGTRPDPFGPDVDTPVLRAEIRHLGDAFCNTAAFPNGVGNRDA